MDEQHWDKFGEAAAALGIDRSAYLREFVLWVIRDEDARPPRRPDVEAQG